MDPVYPVDTDVFRKRVRTIIADTLPDGWSGLGGLPTEEVEPFLDWWRKQLHAERLLAPSWPVEYGGGGHTAAESVVLVEEQALAGVPSGGPNDVFNIGMLGNTILHWGTEDQKKDLVPKLLSGEHTWCQGFSEPDAGSDLAGLGCRAVLDGDEWVLDGQKIWTTYGHLADHIFVLARTDASASKHAGLSFLLVPMDQPGVEVRPIQMMSGDSEFNEVFMSGARCSADAVLGEVNGGWAVAMTLLGFERGEAAAVLPIHFGEEIDRLIELARSTGAADDPVTRQEIARVHAGVEIMRFLGMRTLTDLLNGASPGADAAITKLSWSEHHQRVTELAMHLLGSDGMIVDGRRPSNSIQTDDPGAPNDSASWIGTFFAARAGTIYAGTSEIQRNIIGERILGLPKEPR
jgi:alkylation response protein AidB-like acyl-CoA dehydrogenase